MSWLDLICKDTLTLSEHMLLRAIMRLAEITHESGESLFNKITNDVSLFRQLIIKE